MRKAGIIIAIVLILVLSWTVGISAFSGKERKQEIRQAREAVKRGKEQERLGAYGAVIDYYSDAISLDPTVDHYYLLAKFYQSKKKNELYEKTLQAMVEKFPSDPTAYESLASYYESMRSYEECINMVRAADSQKVHTKKLDQIYNQNRYHYHIVGGNYSECNSFVSGYSQVTYEDHQYLVNEKLELFNKEATYTTLSPFFSDMTGVTTNKGESYFIKTNNMKYLCSEKHYSYLGGLSEGLAVAVRDNKYYYVDGTFREVYGPYEFASTMKNEVAAIKKDGKYYLIDHSGNIIGKDHYDDIKLDDYDICCNQDVIFVKKDDKYHMVDKDGESVGKSTFEDAVPFEDDNMAAVKSKGKWGFVNNEGAVIIKPTYEEALSFSQGLAAVKKDFYWGYINANNKMVIKPAFDKAKNFRDNMAPILKDGFWKYIKLDVSE
ncbi:hypothetical protein lbkm_0128 [Lachnospiraceae bacterium KM106-2]|nr:hypothetical protein lbkm_0128 [Lachnospiraceae bacterium KM106-2]